MIRKVCIANRNIDFRDLYTEIPEVFCVIG